MEQHGSPFSEGCPISVNPTNSGRPCAIAGAFENYQQVAWNRHGERINALFVGGHVKPLHGLNQGAFRYPPKPSDKTFYWPNLPGYVYNDGAGAYFDRNHNGNQFWEDCPIPGEPPTKACQ